MVEFLGEFAKLSPSQQLIFIYCLQNCPHPIPYSGDLNRIAILNQVSYRTVQRALSAISSFKHLARAVFYNSRVGHCDITYDEQPEMAIAQDNLFYSAHGPSSHRNI